jgi:hypothetical protein
MTTQQYGNVSKSIAVGPKAVLVPTTLAVGIFWNVDGVLVIDRSVLSDGEGYGDFITHAAGHYERWQEWQALGFGPLRALGYPDCIALTEYDHWPRGRIVYHTPTKRFTLYADRRLQRPHIIDALKAAFGLGDAAVMVRSDPHYR